MLSTCQLGQEATSCKGNGIFNPGIEVSQSGIVTSKHPDLESSTDDEAGYNQQSW